MVKARIFADFAEIYPLREIRSIRLLTAVRKGLICAFCVSFSDDLPDTTQA